MTPGRKNLQARVEAAQIDHDRRRDRPLIMTAGHLGNHSTLTDMTLLRFMTALKGCSKGLARMPHGSLSRADHATLKIGLTVATIQVPPRD